MVVSEEEAKSGRRSVEREEREKKIVGVFEAGRARGPRDFDRLMTRSLCASREDTLARLVFFFLLASIKYRIPNALECDSKRSREREKGLKAGKMHAKESSLSLLSTFDRKNKKNKKNLLRRRRSDGARVVATTSDDADAGVCELDNHRFGCSLCRGSKRSLRASCVCFAPLRPSLGEERRVLSKEEEATRGSKKKNERMKEWKSEQGFRSQAATKYKNPNLSHKHFQLCDGVAPQEDEAQGASPGLEPEPVPEPPPRRRRGGGASFVSSPPVPPPPPPPPPAAPSPAAALRNIRLGSSQEIPRCSRGRGRALWCSVQWRRANRKMVRVGERRAELVVSTGSIFSKCDFFFLRRRRPSRPRLPPPGQCSLHSFFASLLSASPSLSRPAAGGELPLAPDRSQAAQNQCRHLRPRPPTQGKTRGIATTRGCRRDSVRALERAACCRPRFDLEKKKASSAQKKTFFTFFHSPTLYSSARSTLQKPTPRGQAGRDREAEAKRQGE